MFERIAAVEDEYARRGLLYSSIAMQAIIVEGLKLIDEEIETTLHLISGLKPSDNEWIKIKKLVNRFVEDSQQKLIEKCKNNIQDKINIQLFHKNKKTEEIKDRLSVIIDSYIKANRQERNRKKREWVIPLITLIIGASLEWIVGFVEAIIKYFGK